MDLNTRQSKQSIKVSCTKTITKMSFRYSGKALCIFFFFLFSLCLIFHIMTKVILISFVYLPLENRNKDELTAMSGLSKILANLHSRYFCLHPRYVCLYPYFCLHETCMMFVCCLTIRIDCFHVM